VYDPTSKEITYATGGNGVTPVPGANYWGDYLFWDNITNAWVVGDQNITLGRYAGNTGQELNAIAIGQEAGQFTQGTYGVAIGYQAGQYSQGTGAIAIGYGAGNTGQHANSIVLNAGNTSLNTQTGSAFYVNPIRGGYAGSILMYNQNTKEIVYSTGSAGVDIGTYWGDYLYWDNVANEWVVGSENITLGRYAGNTGQQINAIALGQQAGQFTQGTGSVAVGYLAGNQTQGENAISIGESAGEFIQASRAVAIGYRAGRSGQLQYAVAVGQSAGNFSQGTNAVAIGSSAGNTFQSENAVAVGRAAGNNNQGTGSVAVGYIAGQLNQGINSVAIGSQAGNSTQKDYTTAVGNQAGQFRQQERAVAVGSQAGQTNQGTGSISIGYNSGLISQGEYAIAIGQGAGITGQASQSIAINASNSAFTPSSSGFYVNPVRQLITYPNFNANIPLVYTGTSYEVFGDTSSTLWGLTGTIAFYPATADVTQRVNVTTGSIGIGTLTSWQLQLSADSAAKPLTSSWTIVSDERVKTNIQPFTKGLESIIQIEPITYEYNGKGGFKVGEKGVGVVAQQVLPIVPEAINTFKVKFNDSDEKETELFNFNSHPLTYMFINAFKEQKKMIDTLREEVEILKNKVKDL